MVCACVFAAPVSGFTADSLDIAVLENGDGEVTFTYRLSWFEHIAVFFNIADPADELKYALEGYSHRRVDVSEVSAGSASFYVQGFATLEESDTAIWYATPPLSFRNAETMLNECWFAPLVTPDFSPATTRIVFPDGYEERLVGAPEVPRLVHIIAQHG